MCRVWSRDAASLSRRNRRQISLIIRELIVRHGPDLRALTLEEINRTATDWIQEKSDRLERSKGGEE